MYYINILCFAWYFLLVGHWWSEAARSLKRARDIREQLVDMLEKVPKNWTRNLLSWNHLKEILFFSTCLKMQVIVFLWKRLFPLCTHEIHVWYGYIYLDLVDCFYGRCRLKKDIHFMGSAFPKQTQLKACSWLPWEDSSPWFCGWPFCELVSNQKISLQSTQYRVHFFHEFGSHLIFDAYIYI